MVELEEKNGWIIELFQAAEVESALSYGLPDVTECVSMASQGKKKNKNKIRQRKHTSMSLVTI